MRLLADFSTDQDDSTPVHTPGDVYEVNSSTGIKRYKYVKYDNGTGNLSLSANDVVYYLNTGAWDGYTVTKDLSDTTANMVAGVALGSISDGQYGWVQVAGYNSAVATNGDDDISAGDAVWGVGDGTVDSTNAGTAPTYLPLGFAVANDDDSADTVATRITVGE